MGDVLALIPARGGSKSVPRKNLLCVGGKPLVCHSIATALACTRITRTVVSTDDPEIARVARDAGAEVPFTRPAEYATDDAPDLVVFQHALAWLWEQERYRPELVVHLRPTQPVRDAEIVDRAICELAAHPEADSLRSVEIATSTPYKMYRVRAGLLEPAFALEGEPEAHNMPRQRLPPVYRGNGYVDVLRPHVLARNSMSGNVILPFWIDEHVVDLDYPEQIAELERALSRPRRHRVRRLSEPVLRPPS
jgi:N-acylneuraminate cytidylyltransferase